MAKETDKQMTFEDALNILKGDVFTCPQSDIDEAIRIVTDKDPNHPVLKNALDKIESYKNENNLHENDADVYLNNINDMEENFKSISYNDFIKDKDNADIKDYVNLVNIMDSNSDSTKPLTPKRKKEYIELLFENAKLKVQTVLAGSQEFKQKTPQEKEAILKEEIRNTFFADFARVTVSSFVKSPNKKESKIGTKEYKQYIFRQVQNATTAFKNFIEGKKKVSVKTDNFLSSYADSASQVETYIGALKQKAKNAGKNVREGFGKVAKFFQDKKNKLEKTANFISKNRYEIFKNIKGSFSDNKIKLIGNVSASAAFGFVTAGIAAGTIGAPMTAAVGAYAAYHAVGSWVYPVVAEMRKINRLKREKGEPTLGFKKTLVQAWKNKTSKDENKNSYKARNTYIIGGVINTGIAAAGFAWLKDGMEAIDNARTMAEGVSDGINMTLADSIASTKHAVSVGRIAAPVVAQLTDAGVAYGMHVADPEDKQKLQEAKQTAAAAFIGAGFSALAQGVGFALGSDNANDISENISQNLNDNTAHTEVVTAAVVPVASENSGGGFFSKVKDFFGFGAKEDSVSTTVNANVSQTEVTNVAPTTELGTQTSATEVPTAEVPNTTETYSLFPKEYTTQEEMGISKREFNILVSTTEGTLKNATGEEITLDRAYMNLTDETMAHFPDQTREEVLYKFNRLYAFMRRAYEVGDGTLRETPSGVDYLETRFEKMNLGLSDEKMDTLVRFAQDNTYASDANAKEGLKSMFGDELNDKEISSIIGTMHKNRRFHQYAEEMEAMVKLLGCGEQLSAQEAVKVNALLEQTDNILQTGKENTVFTGLNLSKGCEDDDGEWRRVVTKIEEPAPKVEPETKPVVIQEPLKIEPIEPIKPRLAVKMPEMPTKLQPIEIPTQEPEVPETGVRKLVTTNFEDFENGTTAEKQEDITGSARANRLLRRAGKNRND